VFVTHPNKASKGVGAVILKRMVSHKCTGTTNDNNNNNNPCSAGDIVADVLKVGYCVKCPNKLSNTPMFPKTAARDNTEKNRVDFANFCIINMRRRRNTGILTSNGGIKESFECTGKDKKYSDASILGF